jgi:hypothetical protein
MRLDEIRKFIDDNSFEILKNQKLHREVTESYIWISKIHNPKELAIDTLGEYYREAQATVNELFQRVKKVYGADDNTYKQVEEIWKYLNQ